MIKELDMFRVIASECTEDECLDIIEDCSYSDDPFIREDVRQLYVNRLNNLRNLQNEIEHYEEIYG
jgi:hypothetical protein